MLKMRTIFYFLFFFWFVNDNLCGIRNDAVLVYSTISQNHHFPHINMMMMVVPSPYSVRKLHKKRRRRRIFMLVRRKIAYSPSAARSFISKCRKFFLLSSWAHQRSWYCFCPIRYCYTHPWWYVIIINTKMAYGQTRPCYIDAPSYTIIFFRQHIATFFV